jgi:hypothetical protein
MGWTDYRTKHDEQGVRHSRKEAFPGLTVFNLKQEAPAVDRDLEESFLLNINNHRLRPAVMQGDFPLASATLFRTPRAHFPFVRGQAHESIR